MEGAFYSPRRALEIEVGGGHLYMPVISLSDSQSHFITFSHLLPLYQVDTWCLSGACVSLSMCYTFGLRVLVFLGFFWGGVVVIVIVIFK